VRLRSHHPLSFRQANYVSLGRRMGRALAKPIIHRKPSMGFAKNSTRPAETESLHTQQGSARGGCDKTTRRANQFGLSEIVSSPGIKNIPLAPSGKSFLQLCPSRPTRGAYRDRHERGLRCGGRDSVGAQGGRRAVFRERCAAHRRTTPCPAKPFGEDGLLRTAKACGSGTRCWCQAVGGGNRSNRIVSASSRQRR
jgi:hypothetical protein